MPPDHSPDHSPAHLLASSPLHPLTSSLPCLLARFVFQALVLSKNLEDRGVLPKVLTADQRGEGVSDGTLTSSADSSELQPPGGKKKAKKNKAKKKKSDKGFG